jgi:hypothetical protein
MATKAKEKAEGGKSGEETKFKCRVCGKERPIPEMRTVTRFHPLLIACVECANKLR